MILNVVGPVSKYADETIDFQKPSEYSDVRRFQFPDRILLSSNKPELAKIVQRFAADERINELVYLLRWSCVAEPMFRFSALQKRIQPIDEAGRSVKQPEWLLAHGQFDFNL